MAMRNANPTPSKKGDPADAGTMSHGSGKGGSGGKGRGDKTGGSHGNRVPNGNGRIK